MQQLKSRPPDKPTRTFTIFIDKKKCYDTALKGLLNLMAYKHIEIPEDGEQIK